MDRARPDGVPRAHAGARRRAGARTHRRPRPRTEARRGGARAREARHPVRAGRMPRRPRRPHPRLSVRGGLWRPARRAPRARPCAKHQGLHAQRLRRLAGRAISPRAAGHFGRGQGRPRSHPQPCRISVRRSRSRRAPAHRACQLRRRNTPGPPRRRADPPCLRLSRAALGRSRRAGLVAVRAGGRRGHVVAAVPILARGSRAGLFDLRLDAGLCRDRAVRGQSVDRQGARRRGAGARPRLRRTQPPRI